MKRQVIKKARVYIAMSGGVDSSVAAALLKKQGYSVTGVFMKPWTGNHRNEDSELICMWKQDREDAMRVAAKLEIPLLTWDFSKEYKKEVGDYMIREYKAGRTPNPDVMCNKYIKFGLFLKKALAESADYIATGHYVRLRRVISNSKLVIRRSKNQLPVTNYQLLMARDQNKDQSYFLWTLTQKQLKYCLFPIGDYTKPEVRKLATKLGLPVANKKDSQGVCFIGPLDMKGFLQKYIRPKVGKILDIEGSFIGNHDGIFYYTIGQRHGLDIKNGRGPYYVIKKDTANNILYVGSKKDLSIKSFKVKNVNWINKISLPCKLDIRTRYRASLSKALVENNGRVKFKKLELAATSGQSAVFYRKKGLIGGGIIL